MTARRRRGGATLFFVVFVFPFLLGALSFITDVSRVVVSNRGVNDVAAAMSAAAGHAIDENGNLDAAAARSEAAVTLEQARLVGMLPDSVTVTSSSVDVSERSVTVRVRYRVTSLLLLGLFTDSGEQDGVAVSVSSLCDPSDAATPCAYPT